MVQRQKKSIPLTPWQKKVKLLNYGVVITLGWFFLFKYNFRLDSYSNSENALTYLRRWCNRLLGIESRE